MIQLFPWFCWNSRYACKDLATGHTRFWLPMVAPEFLTMGRLSKLQAYEINWNDIKGTNRGQHRRFFFGGLCGTHCQKQQVICPEASRNSKKTWTTRSGILEAEPNKNPRTTCKHYLSNVIIVETKAVQSHPARIESNHYYPHSARHKVKHSRQCWASLIKTVMKALVGTLNRTAREYLCERRGAW